MHIKKRFLRIAKQFTDESKRDWVYKPYGKNPRSMSVIQLEASNNTELSTKLLKGMFPELEMIEAIDKALKPHKEA